MKLELHKDASALLKAAGPMFDAAGVASDLIRGFLLEIARGTRPCEQAPYLALILDDSGATAAVALLRPPLPLLLSDADEAAVLLVAGNLHRDEVDLPGVVATNDTARRFEAIWCQRTGWLSRDNLALVAHQLTRVIPPRPCPGALRPAGESDRPRLEAWFDSFREETHVHHPVPVEIEVDTWLEGGQAFLWEDGGTAVSMVVRVGDTDTSARIGWVYTPPELRGRGYASCAVAGLSTRLLDEGKRYLSLFTDKANPTSNHIYRAVGYEPLCEFLDIRFTAPEN